MPRNRPLKRIDSAPALTVGGSDIVTSAESIAPPAPVTIQGPRSVAITTSSARSSQAPTAYLDVAWDAPISALDVNQYQVSFAKSSDFSDEAIQDVGTTSARLEVAANTAYYVRVRAFCVGQYSDWVASTPASIVSANDTTPSAQPTSLAASYFGAGDLLITYTPSTSANFKDTQIQIWNSAAKTTLYATISDSTGRVIWTVAQNLAAAPVGTGKTTERNGIKRNYKMLGQCSTSPR